VVARAAVGVSRAALAAGYAPAIVPITSVAPMPPATASGGIDAGQSRNAA
jgi:hypothetical protein